MVQDPLSNPGACKKANLALIQVYHLILMKYLTNEFYKKYYFGRLNYILGVMSFLTDD